ncbi:MAG: hypothetical protein MK089_10750 [Phycisphaerales bacterium]|nr:hypothetical protein [Phycisphaerales bacterium]
MNRLIMPFAGFMSVLISAATALAGYGTVTWGDWSWDPVSGVGDVEVMWQSDTSLYGFQFDVPDGFEVLALTGLECDEGWSLYHNEVRVLAFAAQNGAEIGASENSVGLIRMDFFASDGELSFVDAVFAAIGGEEIETDSSDTLDLEQQQCSEDIYPSGDGDGQVNVNDVLAVLGDWGASGSPYDVTGDGAIDVNDILAILNAWGACE